MCKITGCVQLAPLSWSKCDIRCKDSGRSRWKSVNLAHALWFTKPRSNCGDCFCVSVWQLWKAGVNRQLCRTAGCCHCAEDCGIGMRHHSDSDSWAVAPSPTRIDIFSSFHSLLFCSFVCLTECAFISSTNTSNSMALKLILRLHAAQTFHGKKKKHACTKPWMTNMLSFAHASLFDHLQHAQQQNVQSVSISRQFSSL